MTAGQARAKDTRDPADDGPEVDVIRFFNRWPQGAPRTRVDAAKAALVEALERKL